MYDAKNKILTLNYKAQKKTILKGKKMNKNVYLHLYIKMKDKLIRSF